MSTIPTPEPAECTCLVTAEHRILDRACPRHGTAAEAALQHRSWCDEAECTTGKDGRLVHRSTGDWFEFDADRPWTAAGLSVRLADHGAGIEVEVAVQGAVVASYRMALPPVLAAALGDALLDHAEQALGLAWRSQS